MKKALYVQSYDSGGYIAQCLNCNDAQVQVPVYEVRAAVINPEHPYPGYYLMFGFTKEVNEYGKNPLLFLCEGQSKKQNELMNSLINDCAKMKARTIYAARESGSGLGVEGFFRDLWQRLSRSNLKITLSPAPSVSDFEYGAALLSEWTEEKAIKRPNLHLAPTVLAKQIEDEMNEPEHIKEPRFYAFHALRYLLAGVVRDPMMPTYFHDSSGPAMVRRIAGT